MPFTFDETAAILRVGRNNMTKQLRQRGVLDSTNRPQGRFSGQGYFVVATGSYKHPNPDKGRVHYQKTLVTDKGLDLIERMINTGPDNTRTLH